MKKRGVVHTTMPFFFARIKRSAFRYDCIDDGHDLWPAMKVILAFSIALLFSALAVATPTHAADALDDWLLKLRQQECAALKCEQRYRRVDSNHYFSYSVLQFQKRTFKEQAAKYGLLVLLPNADALEKQAYEEAVDELIYDPTFQFRVAREMYMHDPYAFAHWQNSVMKMRECPPTFSTVCKQWFLVNKGVIMN